MVECVAVICKLGELKTFYARQVNERPVNIKGLRYQSLNFNQSLYNEYTNRDDANLISPKIKIFMLTVSNLWK